MSYDVKHDNATWLFRSPTAPRRYEADWTNWFMELVASQAATPAPLKLPFYRVCADGRFQHAGDIELCRAPLLGGAIDKRLKTVFPAECWPNALYDLRPDVIIRDETTRKATLIEVKTVDAGVWSNVENYARAVEFLVDNDWNARLFYLLSAGHEDGPRGDWELLEKWRSRILLWEDVLAAAVGSRHHVETDVSYRDCLDYLLDKLPPT
jgi:hypothetical protein